MPLDPLVMDGLTMHSETSAETEERMEKMPPPEAIATLAGDLHLVTPEARLTTARAVAEAAAVLLELIGPACFDVAEALEQDLPAGDDYFAVANAGLTPAMRLSVDLSNVGGALCGTSGGMIPECREEWAAGVFGLLEAATWPERGPAAGVRAGSA